MRDSAGPIDFEGEAFKALLARLRALLIEGSKDGAPDDLSNLETSVKGVILAYTADRYAADHAARSDLHEAAEPLSRALAILRNDANAPAIFSAIAGDDLILASQRYETLIGDLEKIAARANSSATRKAAAKRPADVCLRLLVGDLANIWLCATGEEFSANWHKGEPVSAGAQFLHAVVAFTDPEKLPALREAHRWTIGER
ncbi:hypothetical protein [Methylocystis rosea]|uniref:hypothetical protein n=1 Tax=Methylocystis rosea TaxID=173366 RepID=UPI000364D34C|nr:hypothetical protein [Methylocystis rosea]